MAAVCHLGFSKVGNFNFRSQSEAQYASPYQISRQSVEPLWRLGRFSIFQDGGVRHLGFLKVRNFTWESNRDGLYVSPCQILCRSVKLLRTYGQFSIFQDGLDLFYVYFDHPRRAFVGLWQWAKFGWNRCSSFDNMPVLMFCEFGLEMPIHALFWVFFWRFDPLNGTQYQPKVESTGHSGSSGILLMLVSIVVPKKLPGQNRCDKKDEEEKEEEEEHEFLGVLDVFLK